MSVLLRGQAECSELCLTLGRAVAADNPLSTVQCLLCPVVLQLMLPIFL